MTQDLKITTLGRGAPLVLIHGWGLNHGVFKPLAENLSESFCVHLVDLPGFGDNLCTVPSDYNLTRVASMVEEKMPENAIVIGWSLGGLVATQIALTSSKPLRGLITIASSPYFVEQENWPGIKPRVLAGFHQQLSENTSKTIQNFLKIQAMGSPHIRQDIKLISELVMAFKQPTGQVLDDSLRILEEADLRVNVSDITLPFLRLYGSADSLVPKAVKKHMDTLCPASDSYLFEKASHAPFISHPDEFLTVLMPWLKQVA